MNTKAQAGNYAVAFMLAICTVILGIAWAYPINQVTTTSMNSEEMNCTSTTDDFIKAGCWTLDIGQALFIGGIIALAGTIIAARIIFK